GRTHVTQPPEKPGRFSLTEGGKTVNKKAVVRMLVLFALVCIASFIVVADEEAPECTIHVQPSESIQEAIDKAPEGAVICLSEGTWGENLVIGKSLTLRGAGTEESMIEGATHGRPVVQIDSETEIIVHVESLTIQSAKGGPRECAAVYPLAPKTICPDGIAIQGNSEVFLLNLTVANNGRMGVYATDYSHVVMDGCSVLGSGRIGVFVRRYATATAEQTTIVDNNEGVMIADSAKAVFRGCTIADSASYGLFTGGDPLCVLNDSLVEGNGYCGIVVAGTADVSLFGTRVTGNKLWGIAKMNLPAPFSGTLELDDDSTVEDNQYPGIGSM
ncbi:right-handed parallel beta-helix repeat-containing protein, partial [Candidatus Bipolaricaulota bacterium]|nr:right-handed parallel beta-helix repeat-containing protein [Candidatus Bipolaricaulota bacterium]